MTVLKYFSSWHVKTLNWGNQPCYFFILNNNWLVSQAAYSLQISCTSMKNANQPMFWNFQSDPWLTEPFSFCSCSSPSHIHSASWLVHGWMWRWWHSLVFFHLQTNSSFPSTACMINSRCSNSTSFEANFSLLCNSYSWIQ